MKPSFWLIVGLIAITVLAFAGLAPLPGQKDEPTPYVQPAPPGESRIPTTPSGPPQSKPGEGSVPKK
jgi:hypothetical protein